MTELKTDTWARTMAHLAGHRHEVVAVERGVDGWFRVRVTEGQTGYGPTVARALADWAVSYRVMDRIGDYWS